MRDGIKGKKDKVAVDFFGRPIVQKSASVPAALSWSQFRRGWAARREVSEGRSSSTSDLIKSAEDSGAVETPPSAAAQEVASEDKVKVFYRYHEGFSNAVRRPMKISSLL